MSKQYRTNCVDSGNGPAIEDMVAKEETITRRTFLSHVDREQLREIETNLGYFSHHKQGLTMARDYHVSYHKSTFSGKPCVFFVWSAIEYIFC